MSTSNFIGIIGSLISICTMNTAARYLSLWAHDLNFGHLADSDCPSQVLRVAVLYSAYLDDHMEQ
jgi:hypothetical protein